MRRRFIRRARAAATQPSTRAGSASTRSVSKKRALATCTPSFFSPSASAAPCPCTRSAMARMPRGPW